MCPRFELLQTQKKRIRMAFFAGTYTAEQYYELIHRRGRERENRYGFCQYCEARHEMPYTPDQLTL